MNIAVTGGFGSGKSTASKMLAVVISAVHLDTDQLCRQQMQPGYPGFAGFLQMFGNRYLLTDGTLDRQLLRRAVFSDDGVKRDLEMILHPLVRKQVVDCYTYCSAAGKHLVVEVPLLFETGWQQDFSVCVVVSVPEELCFRRVAVRDGLTEKEIREVCATQLSPSEKLKHAHFVIDNGGIFVSMVQQIAWLGKKLLSRENDGKYAEDRLKSLTAMA